MWITNMVAAPLGHSEVLFPVFFGVTFRTSKETDKLSLNRSNFFLSLLFLLFKWKNKAGVVLSMELEI